MFGKIIVFFFPFLPDGDPNLPAPLSFDLPFRFDGNDRRVAAPVGPLLPGGRLRPDPVLLLKIGQDDLVPRLDLRGLSQFFASDRHPHFA